MFQLLQDCFQWSIIFLLSFNAFASTGNSHYKKPKPTPTPVVTLAPTIIATPTVTLTPTLAPTMTVTPTSTPTLVPTATATPTPTATPTATLTPTSTVTPIITVTPMVSPTPDVTITPTASPSPTVIVSPTASPSPSLTPSPTATPSPTPTATPSATPTPTLTPTEIPTPTPTITKIGIDVSYPQCGRTLPTGFGFGIVGVNGGIATTTNPCLSTQLVWAKQALGTVNQSPIQLYVNTGNPGLLSAVWPTNNADSTGTIAPNPYGTCDHTDSLACAWQYGWNRAVDDVTSKFAPAAESANISTEPSVYPWWLDVEQANSWKDPSDFGYQSNRAVLEGMTAYFKSRGIKIGIYSTNFQWGQIIGPVPAESNLTGLPNWRPGASNLAQAQTYCALSPLTTGGVVYMTQYIFENLDHNYSCL